MFSLLLITQPSNKLNITLQNLLVVGFIPNCFSEVFNCLTTFQKGKKKSLHSAEMIIKRQAKLEISAKQVFPHSFLLSSLLAVIHQNKRTTECLH